MTSSPVTTKNYLGRPTISASCYNGNTMRKFEETSSGDEG